MMRFDPRFFHANFSRPMMASVVTTSNQSLELNAVFYKKNDLVGLIWDSVDTLDHPSFTYEPNRDYRGCVFTFRWQSTGVKRLDYLQGPTLTIEGRTATGVAKSWYVRLWNYADGDEEDAIITLDFDNMDGGFFLPQDEDPVYAGDIDRMFISIVAPDYDQTDAALAAPAEGKVTISQMETTGASSRLAVGSFVLRDHGLRMATGYDDSYNLTPERMLDNCFALGYRGIINHYVGMSHYYRLDNGTNQKVVSVPTALNAPCVAWHKNLVRVAKAKGYDLIFSLSYELFDENAPSAWAQKDEAGNRALTGWVPPSTLLSPANTTAMGYLQKVGKEFVQIMVDEGMQPRFQIGEPWWWIDFNDHRIFIYDADAQALFGAANVVSIPNIRSTTLSLAQKNLLDLAGAALAASTAALGAAVRTIDASTELLILIYLPTILDPLAPDAKRVNVPLGWSSPAFDVLQLEDYDWVQGGLTAETATGVAEATARLGYPIGEQHYFSGFVLDPVNKAVFWPRIDAAAEVSVARGTAETFIWAYPQVTRDGYIHYDPRVYGDVGYDEVDDAEIPVFPFRINWRDGMIERLSWLTDVLSSPTGNEQRRANRLTPRRDFDVDFLLKDQERSFFDLWLHRMAGSDCFIPLWHDAVRLGAPANEDDLDLTAPVESLEFDDGTFAILIGKDAFEYEKVEIISSDAETLYLAGGIQRAWPKGTILAPLRRARITDRTKMDRASSRVSEVSVSFYIVKSNPYDEGAHTGDTYLGLPVMSDMPNYADAADTDFQWSFSEQDNDQGYRFRRSTQDRALPLQTYSWQVRGRVAKKALKQLLYRFRGRQKGFWLPTFNDDLSLATSVPANSNQLVVKETGYTFSGGPTSGREYIMIRSWSQGRLYRKVTAATVGPNQTEVLTLDSPIPTAIPISDVRQICYMDTARLSQDQIELSHVNAADGVTTCSVSMVAYRNERTPPLITHLPIPTSVMSAGECGTSTGGDFGSGGIGDGGIIFDGSGWYNWSF
jgi:hypothetical protein